MSAIAAEAIPTRPVLRYHGGKWKLAPWIISHFPAHKVYVEPYCGAASVLMRKPRSYAEVINDLDGVIVNVFRVLQDKASAEELRRLLEATPFARAERDLSYQPALGPVEQARRTIIRSFMTVGADGLKDTVCTGFRAKAWKNGSTPAWDWARYPSRIPGFVARLQGVVIEQRPAVDIIRANDGPSTLHYVDPPYVGYTRARSHYHGYNHEMMDQDHRELAAVLRSLTGMVVLSGYPSSLYDELYPDWLCRSRSAFADGARPRTECLWLNSAAATMTARSAGWRGGSVREEE